MEFKKGVTGSVSDELGGSDVGNVGIHAGKTSGRGTGPIEYCFPIYVTFRRDST